MLIGPFQRFRQHYPGIDLSLFNTTSAQAAELVKSARADLGFVMAHKQSQPLHFTELHRIHWCALGGGSPRLACASNSEPETELTLILLGHDTRTRDLIDSALPTLNLGSYRVMEVGSVDAQIDWAEAGFGIAIVPDFALHSKLNLSSEITALPDFPTTSLGYILRQNQLQSKALKQLLEWVRETIASSQRLQ